MNMKLLTREAHAITKKCVPLHAKTNKTDKSFRSRHSGRGTLQRQVIPNQPTDMNRDGISGMRKMEERITLDIIKERAAAPLVPTGTGEPLLRVYMQRQCNNKITT